jgi:hypothetical protein
MPAALANRSSLCALERPAAQLKHTVETSWQNIDRNWASSPELASVLVIEHCYG